MLIVETVSVRRLWHITLSSKTSQFCVMLQHREVIWTRISDGTGLINNLYEGFK